MLDGDQIMRAALSDQILSVSTLGVHGIRSDHRPGQPDAGQQRGEHGISFVLASTSTCPRITPRA